MPWQRPIEREHISVGLCACAWREGTIEHIGDATIELAVFTCAWKLFVVNGEDVVVIDLSGLLEQHSRDDIPNALHAMHRLEFRFIKRF